MCRHLAYLGPPVRLSALLFDAPHGLVRQASAPRDMRGGGRINADGFGVGWYADAGGPARRYRRAQPIWADPELPGLARDTTAGTVLAAVRSATAGMPVIASACAPFTDGEWLFSLNGRIEGWPHTAAGLAGQLPVTELLTMEAPTDSVLLWRLLRARLAAGEPPVRAVSATVAEVAAVAPGSRLNLLLTDARTIVATTVTHALWVCRRDQAVLVCSEPLDEHPDWRPVPDHRLVVAEPTGVQITALPL